MLQVTLQTARHTETFHVTEKIANFFQLHYNFKFIQMKWRCHSQEFQKGEFPISPNYSRIPHSILRYPLFHKLPLMLQKLLHPTTNKKEIKKLRMTFTTAKVTNLKRINFINLCFSNDLFKDAKQIKKGFAYR